MNPHRVAELLRELADELEAPAAEARPAPDAKESRLPRRVRVHPAPLGQPTDIDVARARGMLRRRGIAT